MLRALRDRCIVLIGQWLEDAHEIAEAQLSDETYTSPEGFLTAVDEHRQNTEAMVALKEELEAQDDG